MKKIGVLVGFIIQMFVFLFGVGLLFITIKGYKDITQQILNIFILDYKIAISVGLLLTLLPLLYVLIRLNNLILKPASISFENPEGKVSISNTAITGFVDRICSNYEEVSRSRSDAKPSKKTSGDIIIKVEMDILGGTNIPETIEKLQQNIRRQLNELLGLENIENVEINISKIISQEENLHEEL